METMKTEKTPTHKFRTRWRRWLGARTRVNDDDWTNLLNTNWSGWVTQVLIKHGLPPGKLPIWDGPIALRQYFLRAIDIADMDDMYKLDGIFAERKSIGKR